FAPRATYRLPRDTNTDTPLPPEEPAGKNPPDGAIIYYYLKIAAAGPVVIDIQNVAGKVLARFESTDQPRPPDPALNVPLYWLRPFLRPVITAGMHRFVWDLHAAPTGPAARRRDEEPPISAIYADTPMHLADWVPAGTYTVKLKVAGKSYTQPLVVK